MIRVISKVNVTDFNAWKSSFEAQTEIAAKYDQAVVGPPLAVALGLI